MMVDWQIIDAVQKGTLRISPFDRLAVQPNSYDVHLGEGVIMFDDTTDPIDLHDQASINKGMLIKGGEKIVIEPNELILGTTYEYFHLPSYIAGMLNGKSSLARLGLTIHQTGGFIDAGFCGAITLEIKNEHPRRPIVMRVGDPIGQIVFFETMIPDVPYSHKPTAKYNNQCATTHSRYGLNFAENCTKKTLDEINKFTMDLV